MDIRDLAEYLRASGDSCSPTQEVIVRFPDQSVGYVAGAVIENGELILETTVNASEIG